MLNWKIVCGSLSLTGAVLFVLCVVWGLLTPQSLHMHGFLESILPGFKWLSWWNFLLGLIESSLWGFYLGVVFVPIHNYLQKRWGKV